MTLVDTSVWVEHLRRGSPRLRGLLDLLASALLSSANLWTLDAALAREARRCGVA